MNKEWKLESITFEFQNWGEHKGKYLGKIRFSNGEFESFQFNLRPEMAARYINLMSSDIVDSANNLGERLIKSLELDKTI